MALSQEENKKFEQVAHNIDPHSELLRVWELAGGVSARVTALEIARADSQTQKMIVRQYGDIELRRKPQVAASEFKLLQFLQNAGLAVPAPYYLDQTGEIFSRPYIVIEFVEGKTEFAPANLDDYLLPFTAYLSRVHHVDGSHEHLSLLPQLEQGRPQGAPLHIIPAPALTMNGFSHPVGIIVRAGVEWMGGRAPCGRPGGLSTQNTNCTFVNY